MKNDTKNEQALLLCALLAVAAVGAAAASPLPAKKATPQARKAGMKANVGPKTQAPGGGTSRAADYFTAVPYPGYAPPMPVSPVGPVEVAQSDALCKDGAALAAQGDWAGAAGDYRQALALWPDSQEALYGLARSAAATGDIQAALSDYRAAVYTSAPFPYARHLREPYADRSMPFALLLSEAGQDAEAVSVYDEVADRLNHEDGQEHFLEADLPEFGDGPGQVPYTPQALQAMAHLAIGSQTTGFDGAELRQAVALAPDSAAANFYLGKFLYATQGASSREAKAYLERAVALGDAHTGASAKVFLQFLH